MKKISKLLDKMESYIDRHDVSGMCLRIYPDGSGIITRDHMESSEPSNDNRIIAFSNIKDLKRKLNK